MFLFAANVDFLPPWSAAVGIAAVAAMTTAALVARRLTGPAAAISKHTGIWILRGIAFAFLALIALNPVRVDRVRGAVERSDVFVVVDASDSMNMGSPKSRWDSAREWLSEAETSVGPDAPFRLRTFTFGRALTSPTKASDSGAGDLDSAVETDSRLVTALRQAPNRFLKKPPAAVVVVSDGRARDEAGLDAQLAQYKQWGIPVHVAPMGEEGKGGDVAIVAAIVPPKVRKSSEVEAHVFLRSYGYDGRRAEVKLSFVEADGSLREVASAPVSLTTGFQSATLRFQSDSVKREVVVKAQTQPDEVSDANNEFRAQVDVDRTKIRVLYVEGNYRSFRQIMQGDKVEYRGPYSDLQQALAADEDIECVVVMAPPGGAKTFRVDNLGAFQNNRGFPETFAELSAFDCVILSDVDRNVFTDKQLTWLDRWIGARGGGLMMVGGQRSFAAGGWADSSVSKMLPVSLVGDGLDWSDDVESPVTASTEHRRHPIWRIVGDAEQNDQALAAMPSYRGASRFAAVKSSAAQVLGTLAGVATNGTSVRDSGDEPFTVANVAKKSAAPKPTGTGAPALVIGRYGKGRAAAFSPAITSPWAEDVVSGWGRGDNRYYAKFWRNVVYWLTEDSSIGRRRLVAKCDKRFYRPGDVVSLIVGAYDETANPTRDYRVTAMVEPAKSAAIESDYAPVRWPEEMERESGDTSPFVAWSEEFEIVRTAGEEDLKNDRGYIVQLPLVETLSSGAASHSLRIELSANEDLTLVDSTSLEVHVLHDPFEQQNPFPNHDLLKTIATKTGGKVLSTPKDLERTLAELPVERGPDTTSKRPIWSAPWALAVLLSLLTAEWIWRRIVGLA